MNITLWILQSLLALHTIMGAIWKFSNPPVESIPSLKAIPHSVWISMSIIELVMSLFLIIPVLDASLGILVPIAAICIAGEMLLFCIVHLFSGETNHSPIGYWSIVAAVCAFIAYGRLVLSPF